MLLLALLLVITGSWLGLRMLAAPKAISGVRAPDAALKEARDAIIGASMAMTVANIIRPGQLPTPDFLDPVEGPANNYDGNNNECARSTWVAGATLPALGATPPPSTRCFGRVPWAILGLGMFGSSTQSDPAGIVPWYAISTNLAPNTCVRLLNPGLLNTTHTPGVCGTPTVVRQPYPWLTVRDYKGNLLTDRAAFVLLLPGPALGGQTRPSAPLAGPAAYLDTVTVTASCSQPCVPGTYNNARFNWLDNIGLSFIQCAPPSQVSTSDPTFAQPYQCNDRLLYVTIDELMELAERRAMSFAAEKLLAFYASNQAYPFAAPITAVAADLGKCRIGVTSGLIPHVAGAPAAAPACSPAFAVGAWFDFYGWGPYIYYATVADCAQPNINCNGGTNRLAAGSVGNARALVIGTGAPIIAAPFATSKAGLAQNRSAPASVADYLDSAENTDGNTRFDAPTSSLTRSYNDKTLVVAP